MRTRAHVYCPFCNATGSKQPVLSPMTCVYILGSPERKQKSEQAACRGSHFEYRCTLCGFTEIHDHMLDEAA